LEAHEGTGAVAEGTVLSIKSNNPRLRQEVNVRLNQANQEMLLYNILVLIVNYLFYLRHGGSGQSG
jgi:hypothetical protein